MKRLGTCLVVMMALVALVGSASAQDKALMAKGQKVYNEYCKTCHQANGQGLGTVYPPLAKSDYLKSAKKEVIIHEVMFGKSGKVKVNGKEFNGVMAPLPSKYTDEDVAGVISYVYNSFGNKGPAVTPADVKKVRAGGAKKKW